MTNIATNSPRKHQIAILLFDGVVLADAFLPYETFSRATLPSGDHAYNVFFCGNTEIHNAECLSIQSRYNLDELSIADTIIIPGVRDLNLPIQETAIRAIREHADRGGRVLSICTGAFVLAATGLLDNLEVTTHWMHTMSLQTMYPRTKVNPEVLYIDNGQFLTSAGAVAGLDLCLYVVGLDLGNYASNELAKISVVQRHRQGGQKQYMNHNYNDSGHGKINELLNWLESNLHENISIDEMASRVFMTSRTFNRKFKTELGVTPTAWITHTRVKHAQRLLETTALSFEQISAKVGLGSTTNFRRHFHKQIGTSPREYKKAFHYHPTS
ncbi:helix-turn-helix domain-containing protein [Vibrio brasiliensis]|uniref:GlxA family transcriptional regulator n=1 Tax=Vibrio brasiliensis TaxID=170652 RepID=UPI001EFD98AC|nr:helix-turn-helix domain-containing protein [Vibrio brasiliensis]MCG9751886.1 helix-turn-helix domain-containing protein [Vibrio brasiliensis]MCG9783601.1 helix-turn-helix domain-containing protein [Vibrio brasiliensis]